MQEKVIKQVTEDAKALYQKGYGDGFEDACNIIARSTKELVETLKNSLKES